MRNPLVIAVLLACASVVAQAQQTPPAPPAAAPATPPSTAVPAIPVEPPQTTTVHGAPPDLSGRWLVLFDMSTNGVERTLPFLLEITTKDGKPEVVDRIADLPAPMMTAIEKTPAKTRWVPTPVDITTISDDWKTMPRPGRGVTSVTTDVWEPSTFDESIRKSEVQIRDAVWVLRSTYAFAPGGQRPSMQINVLAATGRDGTGWKGNAVVAQVVAAPFPVPITLNGTFRMLRVEATPEGRKGFLTRILDAFRGCGG